MAMFLNRLAAGLWLKQQVLCGDHSARCVRTCGRGGGTLQRGVQGKGIHGPPPSISLPETGPLLNRREVESHSEEHRDSSSDSSSCVYRDHRYVSESSGIHRSPQEENNKDSNIGFIGIACGLR